MDEQNLLSRLRHGDEQALAAAITQYSAYVVTVIHNRSRGLLSPEDEDELASSVFFRALAVVPDGEVRASSRVARERRTEQDRRPAAEKPQRDTAGRGSGRNGGFSSRGSLEARTGAAAPRRCRAAIRDRPRDHLPVL